MECPDDLKYTKEHEWLRIEENVATIGITDHAQEQLGDIVFVELPKVDEELKKDENFGVVESVKAVSDIYAPISGKIIEVNDVVSENPETINEECYENGWLVKIEIKDKKELKDLLDPIQYQAHVEEVSG